MLGIYAFSFDDFFLNNFQTTQKYLTATHASKVAINNRGRWKSEFSARPTLRMSDDDKLKQKLKSERASVPVEHRTCWLPWRISSNGGCSP